MSDSKIFFEILTGFIFHPIETFDGLGTYILQSPANLICTIALFLVGITLSARTLDMVRSEGMKAGRGDTAAIESFRLTIRPA